MIYACLSTNIITLGIYEFSFNSFIPKGQLLTAVLDIGCVGELPRHRLYGPYRDDPTGRRRLCLAEPDPRWSGRLRLCSYWMVVHLVVVGTDLRHGVEL